MIHEILRTILIRELNQIKSVLIRNPYRNGTRTRR